MASNANAQQQQQPQGQPAANNNIAPLEQRVQQLELELQQQRASNALLLQQQQAPITATAFALNTAEAIPGLIDFTTKSGGRIEAQCNAGLTHKLDAASGQQRFIKEAQASFKDLGLDSNFDITDAAGQSHNLLTKYGSLTKDAIEDQCKRYINGADVRSRSAQDNHLAVKFLLASLEQDLYTDILNRESEYTVNDTNGMPVKVATLLCKEIMETITLGTKTAKIDQDAKLRDSTTLMRESKGDAKVYIATFQAELQKLRQYGGDIERESLIHIFCNGAAQSECTKFNDYMTSKCSEFVEHNYRGPLGPDSSYRDVTLDDLYKLARAERGRLINLHQWVKSSTIEEEFVALQAEVASLKGGLSMTKKPHGSHKSNPSRSKSGGHHSAAKHSKNKKNTTDKSRQKKEEAWRKLAPKAGEPLEKTVNGVRAKWCGHHMAWMNHFEKDCNLKKQQLEAASNVHRVNHVANVATAALKGLADLSRD